MKRANVNDQKNQTASISETKNQRCQTKIDGSINQRSETRNCDGERQPSGESERLAELAENVTSISGKTFS